MWKFCYTTKGNPVPLFHSQIETLRKYNITPIYVFDGMTASAKQDVMDKRRVKRAHDRSQLEEARIDYEKARREGNNAAALSATRVRFERLQQRVLSVPRREQYQAVRAFLAENNIATYEARDDAEKGCAELVRDGQADVIVSEDYDSLPYLCGIADGKGAMIMGLGNSRDGMHRIVVRDVLDRMTLSKNEFVDLCILSGCDFTPKIHGIACFKAMKLILEHRTLEAICDRLKSEYDVSHFDYPAARREFFNT